jgi:hypothetical protein
MVSCSSTDNVFAGNAEGFRLIIKPSIEIHDLKIQIFRFLIPARL